MNYPITVICIKTKDDILEYAKELAKKRNIPIDLLSIIFDNASSSLKDEILGSFADLNIETLNALDSLSKKIPKESENTEPES